MSKIIKKLLYLSIVSLGCFYCTKSYSQVTVSFQVFYDELSPYGTWMNDPNYGYVWIPTVEAGFAPYATNGYWVFTDNGWTWVSNYPWGWAPFHYGRWYADPVYGQIWAPDNEWGPGWVTWRRSDDYYGWAPMQPGVSITVAYGSGYSVPQNHWRFVKCKDFGRTNIHNYYINTSQNNTIINNTTVINNTRVDDKRKVFYHGGPDKSEVEKHTGTKFNQIAIKDGNKPGHHIDKDNYEIYRPQVKRNEGSENKATPAKVSERDNAKGGVKTEPQKTGNRNSNTQKSGNVDKEKTPRKNQERKNTEPQNKQTPKNRDQQSPKSQPDREQVPKRGNEKQPKQESNKQSPPNPQRADKHGNPKK